MPQRNDFIVGSNDLILVTGATGFIGSRLIETLLALGFCNLRCLVRDSSPAAKVEALRDLGRQGARVEVLRGNLLSRVDAEVAAQGAAVVFHLAAARGEKSVPEAFRNSVVTTRNLLEATAHRQSLKRFVNISSFSVYSNRQKRKRGILDESCPVEVHPELRGDAYAFAKAKQDEVFTAYAQRLSIPFVIVRPGYVIGPGNPGMSGRVGIGSFGIFLHLGGSNRIPFTYVDNCAEAMALAGLKPGVDGEVFNVVDDDLPTSRQFLRLYKQQAKPFKSVYVPHILSYAACYLWERYSAWSEGQLPPAFNRRVWHAYWKKTRYSNQKLKMQLGWTPKIPMAEGLRRHFEACRVEAQRA